MGFSSRLRAVRIAAGLTQREVAEAIGITNSTYCGYETGKREPDVAKIKQLSKILQVSADELLDTGIQAQKRPNVTGKAVKLAMDYDGLDAYGQRMVRLVADEEKARCAEQAHTAAAGESVNGYINKAIDEKMERETGE